MAESTALFHSLCYIFTYKRLAEKKKGEEEKEKNPSYHRGQSHRARERAPLSREYIFLYERLIIGLILQKRPIILQKRPIIFIFIWETRKEERKRREKTKKRETRKKEIERKETK